MRVALHIQVYIRNNSIYLEDPDSPDDHSDPIDLPEDDAWLYIGVTVRNGSASLTVVNTDTGDSTTTPPIDVFPPSSKFFTHYHLAVFRQAVVLN